MRHLLTVVLTTYFLCSSALGQIANASFYIPILHGAQDSQVGLAICNPNATAATAVLTARAYDGTLLSGNGISNPATLQIPANGQQSKVLEEIFGSGIANRSGWVEISSSASNLTGFFLAFDSGLTLMDGAALQSTGSSRIYFPKVRFGENASTLLSVVNTATSSAAVSISFYSLSGTEMLRTERTLAAGGGLSEVVRDLTPSLPATDGYVVVSSTNGRLVGLEMYKNTSDFAALTAVPTSGFQTTGYMSHFASLGGYVTTLSLVNPSTTAQSVQITAGALESNGTLRSPATATVSRTLAPGAMLLEDVASMFGLSGNDLVTGYLRWSVQNQTAGLIGGVDYGTTDGRLMAAVAGQSTGSTRLLFSHMAEGAGYYTGIAFLNPNSTSTILQVESFTKEGTSTGVASIPLSPGEKIAHLVREIIPSAGQQVGGYILATSTAPVFALELFGSSDSNRFLANVPAQNVEPAQQASGSMVSALSGAIVVANDGEATLNIPSGALQANTAISLSVVNPGTLPDPTPDQTLVAVVQALPAGTTFAIPAELRFPLSVSLPPGTTIPVLIYNSQSNTYAASEFTATVDETGTHAIANVTHFTTFALAMDRPSTLPPGPLPNTIAITSLSPTVGLPGDSIIIRGSGFSTSTSANDVRFAGANGARIAATLLFASSTSLTVVVPSGTVLGAVTVTVGGATSNGIAFDPNEPAIVPRLDDSSPYSVSIYDDTATIQLTGLGFRPDSTVLFDGVSVPFTYLSRTRLNVPWARSGAFTTAPHTLAVSNAGAGTSNSRPFYTNGVPLPSMTSLSPTTVPANTPTEVTIRGDGFVGGTLVQFSDGDVYQGTFLDRTTYRFTTRSKQPGTYQVRVSQGYTGIVSNTGVNLTFTSPIGAPTRVALAYNSSVSTGAPALISAFFYDASFRVVPTATHPVTFVISLQGGAELLRQTLTPSQGSASVNFTPPQEGRYTIAATADGLQSAAGSFQAVENVSLTIVSGNNQAGEAGNPLPVPLKVRLTDAGGTPLSGRSVPLSYLYGGYTQTLPATTDLNGVAAYPFEFPRIAGTYTLTATHLRATVPFTLQANPGPPALTGLFAFPNIIRQGEVITVVLTLTDQYFNRLDFNPALVAYSSSMPGQFTFPSTLTNRALVGTYQSTTPGGHTLTAQYPGTTATSSMHTILPVNDPARIAIVSGNNQSARVGTTLVEPFRVVLTDASNNPVVGGLVTFGPYSPSTVNGSTSWVEVYTDAQGVAEATGRLDGSQTGERKFTAGFYRSSTDFVSVTFIATATP